MRTYPPDVCRFRARSARRLVAARCLSDRWDPPEPEQQALIAALDRCTSTVRRIAIESLFDVLGCCCSCGSVLRLGWIATVADFVVHCGSVGCHKRGEPVWLVELKPLFAPAHWSSALRNDFVAAVSSGLIRSIGPASIHLPRPDCGPRRCEACAHPRHHRNGGPALPQVVMAHLVSGAPVRVLSHSGADASTLYRTGVEGARFAIDPGRVSVRRIFDRLVALLEALRPLWHRIPRADQRAIQHAVGAIWARLSWDEWEDIIPLAGPMLPGWAHYAAPDWVRP